MTESKLHITRRNVLTGSALLASSWALPGLSFASPAKSSELKALIKADARRPALSPMLYGGFLEHIGNLINHSLWSEVLDDRKFYYGILEKPDPVPTDGRAARAYLHKWTVIGPMSAISLDTLDPYVGEHSPAIALDGSERRGFAQSGLALTGNKEYQGRIVLTSDARADVAL